jgi:uncharacterized protein (TIGR00369 family)
MNELHERVSNSFDAQGLMKTLGAQLALVAEGEVHILLPYSSALTQQRGYIHAGAVTSILDTACGYAALTQAPADCDVVTAEFKINLMRPAIGDRFLAVGKVQNAGKLLAVCTGEVRAFTSSGNEYKVVALMQATVANVRHGT